ncbi:16S rRNA (guanine(966)-N(2))-methyltransferase RsmD [Rossellomorea vietnamensis]|uniref:16S rRNA (Guanine(966)-N(2))-methyltransferase RsmD n=2 Tax=Rossellomorea TaxID=2837508 RepID=A0A5D4KLM9_9BACI|nr:MULTISPECIES: 16S rRNA (guanine(966)-N(2))-methyltransferase RsmD [Rossellomorea]TYR77635.1 16S rRNA (guanine(966)-N(2))-methyltransferase RsmD [Rossellomorea vietnamensis]TYS77133.1 16S rRNA (guanine(966)-N(2))-methyltransferase RsmD [Rossellomorea aquimaris]
MRVISGECKGRPLKAVPGSGTRPTTDKVKEAIFNIIGPYFDTGTGLDLFAGSGGLGIEALSRGLEKVIFVDKDFNAIKTIKSNLDFCGYSERSEVYRNEAGRALKAVIKRELTFDYIFLDPPYKKQKLQQLLEDIDENGLLNESGYVVCEHASEIVLPEEAGTLKTIRAESYGIIGITIYKKS